MSNPVAALASAFPSFPLEPAALGHRGMWDPPDTYVDEATFEAGCRGRAWDALDSAFVDEHGGALFYVSPEAFAALVPAYLAALVKGDTEGQVPGLVAHQLTRREGWESTFDARLAELDVAQRRAIARVLDELANSPRWTHYADQFQAALASWRAIVG